jgi:hypothetical protein
MDLSPSKFTFYKIKIAGREDIFLNNDTNTGSRKERKAKSAQSAQRKANIFAVLCEILSLLCVNRHSCSITNKEILQSSH